VADSSTEGGLEGGAELPQEPPSAAGARVNSAILSEIARERDRQDKKWGEQNHPDGTGRKCDASNAENRRIECDRAAAEGKLTFRDILEEEVSEVYAETDEDRIREELVQVAAVSVAWIEAIDRRRKR
jgi:hypothetical protein